MQQAQPFVSHVAAADKQAAQALYGRNHARPTAGLGARLDAYLQRRQRRLIVAAAAFAPGQRVLDVGAGEGCMVRAARAQGADVTAVDVVPSLVAGLAQVANRALKGDLEALPALGTFERVLAIGVLDFVVDPTAALHKLAQLTAPGGRLLVLVPTQSLGGLFYRFEKWCRGVQVNIYPTRWCREVLATAGMRCTAISRPLPSNALMTFSRDQPAFD